MGHILNARTCSKLEHKDAFKSDATDIERKDGFNPLAVFNLKHQAFKIEHM